MTAGDDDQRILFLLASGIVAAHDEVSTGAALRVPYPPALQRALDRLTLRCLQEDVSPPAGLAELLRWCEEPLGSWPVRLGGEDVAGDVLVDLGMPTRACHEWALPSDDVEGELFENAVIADVRRICRAAGKPQSYVAFRRLVISEPVLTEFELHENLMDPDLTILSEPVKRCYLPAPLECYLGDHVLQCADCKNLLVNAPDGPICLDDRCPRLGPPRQGRSLPIVQGVRWIAGPVRTFVSSPGRAELRLAEDLSKCGVTVDLWPNFDAYDLKITFTNGEVWAVDVKDWSNPVRLAQRLGPIPRDPQWEQAFYVPARDAVAAAPGYLTTLRARSRGVLRGTGVQVISERGLVRKVRQRAGNDA
ncbi:restriction endonuclease-related protein [Gandjariella thermophila]|uniref:REase associating with pPIWI RE domain-containing protein n=1 Tax=Gandjariella thermophila TaxID=1931992 RepID=A0A4D4JE14_9PSEU|nr:HU-CCDC81 and SPOR domain-containing protein [Gandjariella thermophila]GDY33652.1 hypothetical protein GTS_52850 [Gandjariella thermophila]